MIEAADVRHLRDRSIQIIKEGQAESGAYIAGPKFSVYQYCWFRDGSFIADAMSRAGEIESAEKFFDWCSRVIGSRRDTIASGGILHTRYSAEGLESDEVWPNFQLDGFGTLIWALYEHAQRHDRSLGAWKDMIDLTITYLLSRWRDPSYDWWEEHADVHPATLASIYAAFKSVGHREAENVRAAVSLQNAKLDASLIACATPFQVMSAEEFAPTLALIEEKLVTPGGGVYRHTDDVYYGGGEWMLLTCFLGWHYARIGRREDAQKKLERVAMHMDEEGTLPEQSSEHMVSPEHLNAWIEKWGPSARPLLWSHAMYLTLATELGY